MTDQWTPRLSEFVDGDLPAAEHQALEAHLHECAACASVVDELRRVVDRARTLDDRPPTADLWTGIEAKITAEQGSTVVDLGERRQLLQRRFSFTAPQLLAASIAMLAVGALAWNTLSGPGSGQPVEQAAAPAATQVLTVGMLAADRYGLAIEEIEQILDRERDRLDPVTVRVIEEKLIIIDNAIEDARRALAQDPGSEYLNDHLVNTMRQKLSMLRHVALLAGVES